MPIDMNEWINSTLRDKALRFMPLWFYPEAAQGNRHIGELLEKRDAASVAAIISEIADAYDGISALILPIDITVDPEAFGCSVMYAPDAPPLVAGAVVGKHGEGFDQLRDPGPHTPRQDFCYDVVRLAKDRVPEKPLFANLLAPFTLACSLMKLVDAMASVKKNADMMHDLLEICLKHAVVRAEAFKEAGADGLILNDMAGSIIQPRFNAEFSLPYVRRFVEAVQTPAFPVMLHNCGRVNKMLDNIYGTGCRMYSFGNGLDLPFLLEQAPDNSLVIGNYDPMALCNKAPDVVYSETKALIETCAKYPQFVLGTGCDCPAYARPENLKAMMRALR